MRPPALLSAAAVAAAISFCAVPVRAAAIGARPRDHEVKAALLFNFLKFVEWDADSRTIRVCVVGETRVLDALSALQGRSVGHRTVSVRRVAPADVADCDVAFVPASEGGGLEALLERLARTRALAVGDGIGFGTRGAHLNFYVDGPHVRFEANLAAMRRDRIRVSSKLLKLALLVEGR